MTRAALSAALLSLALVGLAPAASAAPGDATGSLDRVVRVPGGVRVTGWAIDRATASPIDVHFYAGNVGIGATTANLPRPDVAAAFTGFGETHGFDAVFAVAPGVHQICAFAISPSGGSNTQIGCREFTVASVPVGALDAVTRVPEGLLVTGFALDRDVESPISVHIYDNGQPRLALAADAPRPDVAAAFPGYGERHGFEGRFPVAAGEHRVCAYGLNVGPGAGNTLLGCKTIRVSSDPEGVMEAVRVIPGGIRVTGFAIDRDSTAALDVHVYVDGRPLATVIADRARADVLAPFPHYGDNHFFETDVALAAGAHQVCAYAISSGPGANSLLGCQAITLASAPFGALDSVGRVPGGVRVSGFAIDPETPVSVEVHAYADGVFIGSVVADANRPDVAAAFPDYGGAHGYDVVFPASSGAQTICTYALNLGAGSGSALLGCKRMTGERLPFGAVDFIGASGRDGQVIGFAVDPDTAAPITVHVYANGTFVAATEANASRPDVAAAFPGYGEAHGFNVSFPLAAGNYVVCVYALDSGGSAASTLRCGTVSIT